MVTIGICVKNSQATIADTLESIVKQDFPHDKMEIIIVDDGSSDDTYAIIQKLSFKFDVKKQIFHQEWHGLGFSRNTIVNNSSGKYIIWVDGDMILPYDHVRKQVRFMENNPLVGASKAKYGVLEGERLYGFLENISFVAVDHIYGGKPTARILGTGGSIYRRDAILQVGGFDSTIKGVGEDMDAEDRLRKSGWQMYLGNPAVFFERRRKSLRAIWNENMWHGYGSHYIFKKNRHAYTLFMMNPTVAFIIGAWYSTHAFKVTFQKRVFLLPIYYPFKRTAWFIGFLKGLFK
jgi:glycosyltransferase involved in cell wall biosynthesis